MISREHYCIHPIISPQVEIPYLHTELEARNKRKLLLIRLLRSTVGLGVICKCTVR